jgi:hypothetical protein
VTATVVGFVGARRRAFLQELRRINAEFRKRRARISALSVDRWWFEDDPAYARACAQAEITHECIISRLEQCVAAANRYGADSAPFEKALERGRPEAA